MASDTEICNVALSKIGEDAILNLLEDSRAGRACNLVYNPLRQAVLRAHKWNFAIERVALAQLVTTPVYGFAYEYQLPSDFLKLIGTSWDAYNDVKYKIEGLKVRTDAGTFSITYVRDLTDVGAFDSLFREALSTRIAAELAIRIVEDLDLSQAKMSEYEDRLSEAKSGDAQDDMTDEFITTTWINSRR